MKEEEVSTNCKFLVCDHCKYTAATFMDLASDGGICVECGMGRLRAQSQIPDGIDLIPLLPLEALDKLRKQAHTFADCLLKTRSVISVDTEWVGDSLEIKRIHLEDGTTIQLTGARIHSLKYNKKEQINGK